MACEGCVGALDAGRNPRLATAARQVRRRRQDARHVVAIGLAACVAAALAADLGFAGPHRGATTTSPAASPRHRGGAGSLSKRADVRAGLRAAKESPSSSATDAAVLDKRRNARNAKLTKVLEKPRTIDTSVLGPGGSVQPRSWSQKPRPPGLPAGLFKPKASLSQCFLSDPNYVYKMVQAIKDDSPNGKRVLELGPGTGALTQRLQIKFPEMLGIELDQRAIRVLAEKVPGVQVVRSDCLLVNYTRLAEIRGGPLTVVGNLPYHISSQILLTLADHAASVTSATITMQKEVAERIVSRPNCRKYGRLSVIFQLYADPKIMFHIPPTAFFPRPNVISSYIHLDFEAAKERRLALNVDPRDLRNLTNTAFNQRGKFLRNSLERLLWCHTTLIDRLPLEYETLRPQQLEPWEFVYLTQLVFGKKEFPRHLRLAWRGEFGRTVRD